MENAAFAMTRARLVQQSTLRMWKVPNVPNGHYCLFNVLYCYYLV